jgi:hypothetical protein
MVVDTIAVSVLLVTVKKFLAVKVSMLFTRRMVCSSRSTSLHSMKQ